VFGDRRFCGEEIGREGEGAGRTSHVSGLGSAAYSGCERGGGIQGSGGADGGMEAAGGPGSGNAALRLRLHWRSLWTVAAGAVILPVRPTPGEFGLESLGESSPVSFSSAVEWPLEEEERGPSVIGLKSPWREDDGLVTPGGVVRRSGETVFRNPSSLGQRIKPSRASEGRHTPVRVPAGQPRLFWVRKELVREKSFTSSDCFPVGREKLPIPTQISFARDLWSAKSGAATFAQVVKMQGGGRGSGRTGAGRGNSRSNSAPSRAMSGDKVPQQGRQAAVPSVEPFVSNMM
jgi:hypothetical protein